MNDNNMHQDRQAAIKKLGELINDIQIAMLTTIDSDGHLRSRPMATENHEFDGNLWFFTHADVPKVDELKHDSRVNVTYSDVKGTKFVSVSGRSELVRDTEKAKQLWSPSHKAWFPKGPDDPNLMLIKVHIERAEYWDQPAGQMAVLFSWAKAVTTGEAQRESAHHEKIKMTG